MEIISMDILFIFKLCYVVIFYKQYSKNKYFIILNPESIEQHFDECH